MRNIDSRSERSTRLLIFLIPSLTLVFAFAAPRLIRKNSGPLTASDHPFVTEAAKPLLLPAVAYGTGGSNAIFYGMPDWITMSDVNGDGKIDLLIANWCAHLNSCPTSNGSVGVLLGNGDGTFQAAVTYDSGDFFAFSVLVADLNGDHKPDLVIANGCANLDLGNCEKQDYVGVLLGNGDGTFQSVKKYADGLATSSMALADVNNDGKIDVVVTNRSDCSNPGASGVGVLLGRGDGTFQPMASYASRDILPVALAVADINGDGNIDLAVANSPNCSNTDRGNVGILLGNGDGTFRAGPTYSYIYPSFVQFFDVNKDGKPDLLATPGSAGGGVTVQLGNGDGTFQPAAFYATGGDYQMPSIVADLNGDGNPDLVVPNLACSVGGGCLAVLLGVGDGTFHNALVNSCGGLAGCASVAVGDTNGDGKPDLIVADEIGSGGVHHRRSSAGVLLGNGDGTFQPVIIFDSGGPAGATWVSVADLDGDGKPDVLIGNARDSGSVGVLLNNTIRPFNPTVTAIGSDINPAKPTQLVTYTARITSQTSDTLTGTIQFSDAGAIVASVPVAGNQASYSVAYPQGKAGQHTVTASYMGDADNGFSHSDALIQEIVAATKTVVTTSGTPSHFGQTVTFTATVSSKSGAVPDGELVTFHDGNRILGTSTLSGGKAEYQTATLSIKSHSIKAIYGGDPAFTTSSGHIVQVVVP